MPPESSPPVNNEERNHTVKSVSWHVSRLPRRDQSTFLVTGATSGIGYFIAEQLATTGAEILLAGRSERKLALAGDALRARVSYARVRGVSVDLGDLASVRNAAEILNAEPRLDGIVLNAGVLARRAREETVDGHELVYGTNHLAHFALAALIYPLLARTAGSRVITMGSLLARRANLDLDDLESTGPGYQGFVAYKRSKLAQMIFALELDRRLKRAHSPVASLLAHPGGALNGLTPPRPPAFARNTRDIARALPLAAVVQGKHHAAWPAVRALLDPAANGGQLWGPRVLRTKGQPRLEQPTDAMRDPQTATQLWTLSEQATNISWPSLPAPVGHQHLTAEVS